MRLGLTLGLARTTFFNSLDWDWLKSVSPIPLPSLNGKVSYREDLAQSIRDGAGVPSGVEVGIQSGVTPGLTNAGILSAGSKLHITLESQVQTLSSSGTGTLADPYIIKDLDYDGGNATNWGLRFNNALLDVHVEFQNCSFHDWTSQNLWFDNWGDGRFTFRNCDFYGTSAGAYLMFFENCQGLRFIDCEAKGGLGTFYQIGLTTTEAGQTLEIENFLINTDEGNYTSGMDIFKITNPNCTITASHIETDTGMVNNGQRAVFGVVDCADSSSITNFEGGKSFNHFLHDDDGTIGQKQITIQYFDIQDTDEEPICLVGLSNSVISHGFAAHNTTGSGFRLIKLMSDGTAKANGWITDTDVTHVKFTKSTGTGAGNECLETARAKNTRFMNCWTTTCTEDAYEHINVISGCTIEYCVADNCTGQIVDYFKSWDETGWALITDTSSAIDTNSYAHHIYGDCASFVVTMDGFKGGIFHDIYADNTASSTNNSIRIQDRDAIVVRNVFGSGPLPLQAERGNGTSTGAVLITGGDGTPEVRFYDSQLGDGSLTTVT